MSKESSGGETLGGTIGGTEGAEIRRTHEELHHPQLQNGAYTNGEEQLLALSPAFKRRYTWDGDFMLGCTYGCEFCYYRWINASKDYIGTGRLKDLTTPEGMIEFMEKSKLFLPNDIMILGARSDASMYPREIEKFLELVSHNPRFKNNIVLGLHRGPATNVMRDLMVKYPQFRFGTTITPRSHEIGWTKIKESQQFKGLRKLLDAGVEHDRISIQVGPLNSENIDAGIEVLRVLESMGFKHAMVRGVAFGTFGVDREKELAKMAALGFIEQSVLNRARETHEYYVVKNFLTPEAYTKLQAAVPAMRIHRRTYTYYRDVWGVPVSYNRANKVRESHPTVHSEETVRKTIEKYALHPVRIERKSDHYVVELPEGETATEDIAMTVGAELETAVIFNNYRNTSNRDDVQFYKRNSLFYLDPYIPSSA